MRYSPYYDTGFYIGIIYWPQSTSFWLTINIDGGSYELQLILLVNQKDIDPM